jgi:hypothetical protein
MGLGTHSTTGEEATPMRCSHPGSFREQVRFLRRQFLQDGDLPFTNVLTQEVLEQALAALTGWRARIFSPLVTLWVFLGQVLNADHSCRAAVARLIAHRVARGHCPCSSETRIAAIFSLACGAVLDVGIGRYAGKGQSELGLLRTLWDLFRPGDVVLADRLMCAWTEMVMLKQRGIDSVCHLTSHRQADFRRGKRLGPDDHLIRWVKPTKPRSIDRQTYDALPEFLMVRECRVRVEQPGFRVQSLIIATTLLDAGEYTKDDLATLYWTRWQAELDLRSLKETMHMRVLRCKTPELVRKELWTHLLAYNLIRTIIAQAASKHGLEPRSISFKGAIQTLEAFQPVIALQADEDGEGRSELYQQVLDAIARHRVADRPDRVEPRLRKRRPKHYGFLRKPRAETKRDLLKGVS